MRESHSDARARWDAHYCARSRQESVLRPSGPPYIIRPTERKATTAHHSSTNQALRCDKVACNAMAATKLPPSVLEPIARFAGTAIFVGG